jgi:hypothetical protein
MTLIDMQIQQNAIMLMHRNLAKEKDAVAHMIAETLTFVMMEYVDQEVI